jgi:hypothetical protein
MLVLNRRQPGGKIIAKPFHWGVLMHVLIITAIAATLFGSMNCCFAQARVGATDTELRAAYCLGVATAQLEDNSAEVASLRARLRARTITPEDRLYLPIAEEIEKDVRERRDRFRDYLVAKGYLKGRDVQEIRSALLRGPADDKRCGTENDDPIIKACKQRCGPIKTLQDGERCDIQCGSDACVRTKRCLQQFLPF